MAEEKQNDVTTLTVQLLSAFVSRNTVSSESLADLIKTTRAALAQDALVGTESVEETFTPAVSVRKSLASPHHIISLIDGKSYKTLKRHLAKHGLTPDQYRERYGLPKTYPLVAQSYSETRRTVAAKNGLGRKRLEAAEKAPSPAAPAAAVKAPAPSKAKKEPASPAQKQDGKGKPERAAKPLSTEEARSIPTKTDNDKKLTGSGKVGSAPARKGERKRLSIASPKKAQSETAVTKPASKPKSLQAALDAASTHLKGEATVREAGTSES